MKRNMVLFIIIASCILLCNVVFASVGEWEEVGTNWKYKIDNEYVCNTWKSIDGINYHFDIDGNMATGLCEIDGRYYAFKNSGEPYKEGESINFRGVNYRIGGRGLVMKLSDDINIDAFSEYIENRNYGAETYASNVDNNNSQVNNNTCQIENNTQTSLVHDYIILEEDKQRLNDFIARNNSLDTICNNVEAEFTRQLDYIVNCLTSGNNVALTSNLVNIDVNDSNTIFKYATVKYKSTVKDIGKYMTAKFPKEKSKIREFQRKLNDIVANETNKYRKN